ncbi:hypothetical protein LCM19_10215 [Qipengyuania flava]|nr:hypothetical protein [Qipengyuania flava]
MNSVYADISTTTPASTERLWGKRNLLIAVAIGIAAFAFYNFVLQNYYYGDPAHYQRYYDSIIGRDLLWALQSQREYLGSSELIYPTVAWLGSNSLIERNLLMAAIDGAFYAVIFYTLKIYRCHPLFIALFLTNFYVIVLATSAERLKFAYIFLFLAFMTAGRVRLVWAALAPLAHFQSLITLGSIFIWHFFSHLSAKMKVVIGAGTAIGGMAMLYFFLDALLGKFASYQGRGDLLDILSGLALCGIALAIFRNRTKVFVTLAPLIALTFVLGSDRMNMVTFTTFIYLCLVEEKTKNPAVLAIMIYLSFKSIGFISNVLKYGNGFA